MLPKIISAILGLTAVGIFLWKFKETQLTKHRCQVFILDILICFSNLPIFFSTSYLFLSFVLHAFRTVILRIPQCRIANRFPLISCRYINAMKSALPSKVELTTCSRGLSYSLKASAFTNFWYPFWALDIFLPK